MGGSSRAAQGSVPMSGPSKRKRNKLPSGRTEARLHTGARAARSVFIPVLGRGRRAARRQLGCNGQNRGGEKTKILTDAERKRGTSSDYRP